MPCFWEWCDHPSCKNFFTAVKEDWDTVRPKPKPNVDGIWVIVSTDPEDCSPQKLPEIALTKKSVQFEDKVRTTLLFLLDHSHCPKTVVVMVEVSMGPPGAP